MNADASRGSRDGVVRVGVGEEGEISGGGMIAAGDAARDIVALVCVCWLDD